MITVHILTNRYVPQTGGLERWTHDLAQVLAANGVRPIVYVCEHRATAAADGTSPIETVEIGNLRAPWEAALEDDAGSKQRIEQERVRLIFHCVRAELARRVEAGTHIVLSNFLTTPGFTAHQVAESLGLPHIPVIAGTDLNRGFRNASERAMILEVCHGADVVIGKSQEQVRVLRRRVPGVRCEVIETSVELPEERWRNPGSGEIVVFSDSGFSFKKGTGVLMDAFLALRGHDIPARLEICGGDQAGQENYWRSRRLRLEAHAPGAVSFPGYLSEKKIVERIRAASIYASATLGEGASAARIRALCLGVPMVTTACGELADPPCPAHVRLVPVADAAAFSSALLRLATELMHNSLLIDSAAVDRFRLRFDPRKEWEAWLAALNACSNRIRS